MSSRRSKQTTMVVALAVLACGLAAYFVNQNYELRIVRLDAPVLPAEVASDDDSARTHSLAAAAKPAPIVIRLACVDAGDAVKGVSSSVVLPKKPSLRQQLRQADRSAPAPIPAKRCRPSADVLSAMEGST